MTDTNRFDQLRSRVVTLVRDDIDTDQIIPARFLKVTNKKGLGDHLFQDWRYLADGSAQADFVLNQPQNRGAQILLAGDNFGCGSSREHAPWALTDFGFRSVIATSFADIFCNNALKNGLLPVAIPPAAHRSLRDQLRVDPSAEVYIDLEAQSLQLPNGEKIEFPVDEFARKCLLEGVDQLGYLLSHADAVDVYEQQSGKVQIV